MASPTVDGTNSGARDTTATSHTVNYPGAGMAAGKLIILMFAHKDNTAGNVTWADGTLVPRITGGGVLDCIQSAGSAGSCGVFYRWTDGSEGASLTVSTVNAVRMAYVIYVIGGAENPATQTPEGEWATSTNTAAPNPPSITPTGGSKDYLFLPGFVSSHGRIISGAGIPTNYTDGLSGGNNAGTATHVGVGSARRALTTAGPEDPSAFTSTGTGIEEGTVFTVVVHPSGGAPPAARPKHLGLMGVG